MKQIFNIDGMTCQGCRSSVENALNTFDKVTNAIVDLDKKEAIVASESKISKSEIQTIIGKKYAVSEKTTVHSGLPNAEEKSTLKQLYPLFLIFGFITTASILIHTNPWSVSEFMLTFMGLFYVVFSFFKLLDIKGFATSFAMYDPIAKKIYKYGLIYPFIELCLGVFFLMRIQTSVALVFTLIILGITTIGVTKSLINKQAIQCACLGSVLNLPMTKATFIENTIMIVMAVFMLVDMF